MLLLSCSLTNKKNKKTPSFLPNLPLWSHLCCRVISNNPNSSRTTFKSRSQLDSWLSLSFCTVEVFCNLSWLLSCCKKKTKREEIIKQSFFCRNETKLLMDTEKRRRKKVPQCLCPWLLLLVSSHVKLLFQIRSLLQIWILLLYQRNQTTAISIQTASTFLWFTVSPHVLIKSAWWILTCVAQALFQTWRYWNLTGWTDCSKYIWTSDELSILWFFF